MEEYDPVKTYANLLLLTMLKGEQEERTLRASVDLPALDYPDCPAVPTFLPFANCLKAMAHLDPVPFPEPKEASLPVEAGRRGAMHDFTVHLLFKDQGDGEVHIRIEDHGPSRRGNEQAG